MGMRNDSCMTYLYAVVSRQPGGGRCCSSGMSHGFSKEASRCRIEAGFDVPFQDPCWHVSPEEYSVALGYGVRTAAFLSEPVRM